VIGVAVAARASRSIITAMGLETIIGPRLDRKTKFADPERTAKGEPRASVDFRALKTLWINTGTLCNIACENCYIDSSPTNDALEYIRRVEHKAYLDELDSLEIGPIEIAYTGGEPFMNPDMADMAGDALARGHPVLILTNAMKPLTRPAVWPDVEALIRRHGGALTFRISLDHYDEAVHDRERGQGAFQSSLRGVRMLRDAGARLAVAGRSFTGETDAEARAGYGRLFARETLDINPHDPERLVVFPEMDETADTPEITKDCWGILGVDPASMMCASSRMVVKRRGADAPEVVACTLTPYDPGFSMGMTLRESFKPVSLNHPHCSRFCVLGGASCSA